MKLIRKYKGYSIEFIIPDRIDQILLKNNINIKAILRDDWEWFEVTLFEVIDENNDGLPDKKYGNKFRIIFYELLNNNNQLELNNHFRLSTKDKSSTLFKGKRRLNSLFIKFYAVRA